jgi:hypothetical protein
VATQVNDTTVPGGTVAAIDGATVVADLGNVNVAAREHLKLSLFPGAGAVAGATVSATIAVADVVARPQAYVAAGSDVHGGQAFDLEATADNTEFAGSPVPILPNSVSVGSLGATGLAAAQVGSVSSAEVRQGARVTTQDATVLAENHNNFDTESWALTVTVGVAGIGAVFVLTNYVSSATATVNGALTALNDANVIARSVNDKAVTAASGSALDPFGNAVKDISMGIGNFICSHDFPLVGDISPIGEGIQDLGSGLGTLLGGGQTVSFTLAAGVALASGRNTATASVGPTGNVQAGRNLTVLAHAEDNFQANASGSAGDAGKDSVGGGVTVTNYANQANAFLDQGAVADVGGTVHVLANAVVPNQVDFFGATMDVPDHESATGTDRIKEGVSDARATADGLSGILGALELLFQPDNALAAGVANTLASSGSNYRRRGPFVGFEAPVLAPRAFPPRVCGSARRIRWFGTGDGSRARHGSRPER